MRVLLIDFNPFMPPVTPVSLGHVGAVLQAHGDEVAISSLGSTSRFSPRRFQKFLTDWRPRLIGFGTYQRNIFHIHALAGIIKETKPDTSIILGGPQITFLPDIALNVLHHVDYLCRGEGELVLSSLAQALEMGKDTPVPGTTSRCEEGGFITGDIIDPPKDLDELFGPQNYRDGVFPDIQARYRPQATAIDA